MKLPTRHAHSVNLYDALHVIALSLFWRLNQVLRVMPWPTAGRSEERVPWWKMPTVQVMMTAWAKSVAPHDDLLPRFTNGISLSLSLTLAAQMNHLWLNWHKVNWMSLRTWYLYAWVNMRYWNKDCVCGLCVIAGSTVLLFFLPYWQMFVVGLELIAMCSYNTCYFT